MADAQRRLILGNGERYVETLTRTRPGRAPEMPRPYSEARDLVKNQVSTALRHHASLPLHKRFADEAVLCLRLHPDMMAKSYDPTAIFNAIPELANVGSRNYNVPVDTIAQTTRIQKHRQKQDAKELKAQLQDQVLNVTGRLVFVRSDDAGFKRLLQLLDTPERSLPQTFRQSVQEIEAFDLLSSKEQILGFAENWLEGRVEIILHPSCHNEEEQRSFLKNLFSGASTPWKKTRIAAYPNGPTFVSCHLTRSALDAIAGANPLRAVHPLAFGGLEDLRAAPSAPSPKPTISTTRSTITVGMFDGGLDPNHSLLKGHVVQDEALSIKVPQHQDCAAHGTAVAGALLFGPLNDKDATRPLPSPNVSVVSFRVLPTSDPKDIDLYEAIDVIEAAVPARPDIKVFNLSFGPRGPIVPDSISRFTYALDTLAAARKVTFCVAVGNDGDAGPGLDRIQAPADLVNGIGVGAYTIRGGHDVHAPYSCKGPGRECAKIKPDLVAFGGCDQMPIQLLSATPGQKIYSHGTSFASPIVASLCAQTADAFDRGTTLLARALLVHSARHPAGDPDHLLGHGIVRSSVDDILRCNTNEVTIIFQGDLIPTKQIKLPVMLPQGLTVSGNIHIRWTIAALPPVYPNHPSDYTACCIDDTFYPNNQLFAFTRLTRNGKQEMARLHLQEEAAEVARLVSSGWKQASMPVSVSGNTYPTETERRAAYKWEPIVRRSVSKRASSLLEPFLVLHAIPRHNQSSRLDYAAIVTISAPKCSTDLYDAVLRRYTVLQPIRMRTQAELQVSISV